MTTIETPAPAAEHPKPVWRRLLPPVLSLVLIGAGFFWFLPQFASIAAVWTVIQDMSAVQIGILLVAAIWNLATYQFVIVATMPGMNLRQATVSTETTTAVSNTVVGGASI